MNTKKSLIADSLANLSGEDLAQFRFCLSDSYTVPQSKVEKKDYMELANVLVKQFTEDEAHIVTSNILRRIMCNQDAKNLDSRISQLTSNASGSHGAGHLGVANVPKSSNLSGKHFVDKYKLQLIQRVTNIDPILDRLLDQEVLQDGIYEDIRQTPGNQQKMRKIYQLALKSGDDAKNIFMELLRQQEPYLVKDLLQDP
ncbi:apoptosis-associated speck-like protein containing a CARD [Stigmatopora nigra]